MRFEMGKIRTFEQQTDFYASLCMILFRVLDTWVNFSELKKTGIFPRIVSSRDIFSVFTFFFVNRCFGETGLGGPTAALQFHAASRSAASRMWSLCVWQWGTALATCSLNLVKKSKVLTTCLWI